MQIMGNCMPSRPRTIEDNRKQRKGTLKVSIGDVDCAFQHQSEITEMLPTQQAELHNNSSIENNYSSI